MIKVIGVKLRLISATILKLNSAMVFVLIVQKSFIRNFIRVINPRKPKSTTPNQCSWFLVRIIVSGDENKGLQDMI